MTRKVEILAKCSRFVKVIALRDGKHTQTKEIAKPCHLTQYFVISITSLVGCGPGPAMLIEKAECGKYKMMMKYSNESLPAIPGWVGQCQPELNQHLPTRPHLMFELKVKSKF